MNSILDESKYTDVKLFEMKKNPDVCERLDELCEKKCPGFLKARVIGDFEEQLALFVKHCQISFDNASFIYFFDFDFRFLTGVQNITPAYDIVLNNGLSELLYENEREVLSRSASSGLFFE